MVKKVFKIKSEVWLYPGMSGWHFLTIPKKEAGEIKVKFGSLKRGFGSLPVLVTLGKSKWNTSIFPDKKSETYLLPLKAKIRVKEKIFLDDFVVFSIKILV